MSTVTIFDNVGSNQDPTYYGIEKQIYTNCSFTLTPSSSAIVQVTVYSESDSSAQVVRRFPLQMYSQATTINLGTLTGRIGFAIEFGGTTAPVTLTLTAGSSAIVDPPAVISTVSTCVYVDVNRTDAYIEVGTVTYPFKTLGAALATVTKATQIVMAPGAYSESIANYPAFPLVVYGNGSTLTLAVATTLTLDYTAYDLNVIAPSGITYVGVAATTRFILRNGSRKGPMVLSSGFLDLQACTQTWNTTSDKITVTGTGNLLEIGCINTLPVTQTSANSVVFIENCNWNTARASTYLLESSAGQFTVANTVVANTSATAGGGIYIHNAQTASLPNIVSGCFVAAVNAVTISSGVTLYSKVASSGAVVAATIVAVPDVKMYTAEPFTPIAAGFTVAASTPDNLFLGSSYAINLGTALVAKYITISSTASYTIVVPTGVTMYYNGVTYTAVTKTVPSGYTMNLNQVSATVWFLQGSATLS